MTLATQAKGYAYRRLAMRPHHSLELREALAKREYAEEVITPLIEELTALGYLNDAEWVAGYVRRLKNQRYGPLAIRQKLRMKGIAEEDYSSHLEEAQDPDEQKTLIAHLLSTRYKSRDLKNPKERQKVIAALARKGFTFPAIFATLPCN